MTSDLQDIPEDASLARLLCRVILMESRLSALEGAAGGISKETVEQVIGGSAEPGATEASTLVELANALRMRLQPEEPRLFEGAKPAYWISTLEHDRVLEERNEALAKLEVRDGKIVGLEEGLAAMTAERDEARTISEKMSESHYRMSQERDDQYLRNTQLEWTKSDLIARNNSLMDTLKAERKARQEWDAANPPAPSPPDTGGEPGTFVEVPLSSEEYVAWHQKAYPGMWEFAGKADERKALYGEMLGALQSLLMGPGDLHVKAGRAYFVSLISRAEKAMEGDHE